MSVVSAARHRSVHRDLQLARGSGGATRLESAAGALEAPSASERAPGSLRFSSVQCFWQAPRSSAAERFCKSLCACTTHVEKRAVAGARTASQIDLDFLGLWPPSHAHGGGRRLAAWHAGRLLHLSLLLRHCRADDRLCFYYDYKDHDCSCHRHPPRPPPPPSQKNLPRARARSERMQTDTSGCSSSRRSMTTAKRLPLYPARVVDRRYSVVDRITDGVVSR